MVLPRFIPVILLSKGGMYVTQRFKTPVYIGDPLNAIKIFNDSGADEVIIIDLEARNDGINFSYLEELATEAFMPVAYGGGISTIGQMKNVVRCGVEKILLNTVAFEDEVLLSQAVAELGSSTITVSLDYKRSLLGKEFIYTRRGSRKSSLDIEQGCKYLNRCCVGEVILHSIDRDGTMKGYDLDILNRVVTMVNMPVVVLGGASGYNDLTLAVNNGASGAAAGSLFAFAGPHKAVLINYPEH